MALKPTIYKFAVNTSDLDRERFESHALTMAQHPSESTERMMARCLAFLLNADEGLSYTSGLSNPDEPAIWQRSLDDRILQWIDVGEPSFERIKKATRQSAIVKVYSFNSKSEQWWRQVADDAQNLRVEVFRFGWSSLESLASVVQRTMEFPVTISGGTLYLSLKEGDFEISCMPVNRIV